MTDYIADFAFRGDISAASLRGSGFMGVIVYAGCSDATKNIPDARYREYVKAGLQVGLVVEESTQSALGGANVGAQHARQVVAAAKRLGHTGLIIGTGDWNTQPGAEVANCVDFMRGFQANSAGHRVAWYGNYRSSVAIKAAGRADVAWLSDSKSFSPEVWTEVDGVWLYKANPTMNVTQMYGDSHGAGLRIDTNIVRNRPLYLQGEPNPTQPVDTESASDTEIEDDEMIYLRFINSGPKNNTSAVYVVDGGRLTHIDANTYAWLGRPPVHVMDERSVFWSYPITPGTPDFRGK